MVKARLHVGTVCSYLLNKVDAGWDASEPYSFNATNGLKMDKGETRWAWKKKLM